MNICIPVVDNCGLESRVCGHFGSAPFFMIVDTDTSACKAVENGNQHHAHGMCQPMNALAGHDIGGVVVGGIGAGALMKLRAGGITVYLSEYDSVKDTLEAFKSDRLNTVSPDMACGGHGHGGGHCHG